MGGCDTKTGGRGIACGFRRGRSYTDRIFTVKAAIRLEGTSLEEISAENGLRQGYCMTPALFNLYTCLVVERWLVRVEGAGRVGVTVKYKYDKKLESSALGYQRTGSEYGLKVSHQTDGDGQDGGGWCYLDRGSVEVVDKFSYLGSLIEDSGRMNVDVNRRVAQASKSFGALRMSVFLDKNLSLITKRKIYNARVLSVLLYGVQCWIPAQEA